MGPRTLGFSIQSGKRRSQQGNHRLAQGGRNVPRTAIGGNHHPAAGQAAFAQPEADGLGGQGNDARRTGTGGDLAGRLALAGSAEHEYIVIELIDDLPGQCGAMFGRPEFCRPESPGGIQRHDPPVGPQPQIVPDPLGLAFSAAVTFSSNCGDSSGQPMARARTR